MTTIQIAGVPEHFNLPWHLAIENGEFSKNNIDLQWTDVPEGTGKMCQMLREGTTDIAIILTEGIVKDITNGNPSKIVQVYVETPLIWGIHVAAKSNYQSLEQLQNTKTAISRLGSGSHLMAFVNADNQKWAVDDLQFEIVNTIEGAVTALNEGAADYFMWERFMTQPLVDNGTFRRIADCPTPWPCFVVAVRDEIITKKSELIAKILDIINSYTFNFKSTKNIIPLLAERYHQKEADLEKWLSITEWSQKSLSNETLDNLQNRLLGLGIINQKITATAILKEV